MIMGTYINKGNIEFRDIVNSEYPAKLAEYLGDILLVGINYDKETKHHTCKIESLK